MSHPWGTLAWKYLVVWFEVFFCQFVWLDQLPSLLFFFWKLWQKPNWSLMRSVPHTSHWGEVFLFCKVSVWYQAVRILIWCSCYEKKTLQLVIYTWTMIPCCSPYRFPSRDGAPQSARVLQCLCHRLPAAANRSIFWSTSPSSKNKYE